MTVFPLIIDSRPGYYSNGAGSQSLLLTPVGTQLLLARACECVRTASGEPPTILAEFETDAEYEARVRTSGSLIRATTSIARLAGLLADWEPSDWLLVLDPRCFSADGFRLNGLLDKLAASHEARHLVATERSRRGTKEYVQLDGQGYVQRVQRYYDGVTWLQTRAVIASLVPVSAVRGLPADAFSDLTTLRAALVARGVLSRDLNFRQEVFDLSQAYGLLRLCERTLRDLAFCDPPEGYTVAGPGVWVGAGCSIRPTARLCGPIVLRPAARVDAGATIIGPAIIGENSCISRKALLTQCLLAPHTFVPERSTWQQCVLSGAHQEPCGRTADLRCGAEAGWSGGGAAESLVSRGTRNWRETYVAVKRVMDGVVALLGIVVLSPLLLLAAAAIALTSRGPVFFYHEREGKNGKPFRCCKFRTMVAEAHRLQRDLYRQNALDGPQFKLERDPRITWLGRRLRETNIDELPQLFNVVLGQMSLIGPRPSPFRENQICVPWREARLAVRPGITGLWQTCRQDRKAGDFHQWIHYDMLYVRHLSPWLDLKILIATLLTLGGRWSVPVTWLISARKLQDAHERTSNGRDLASAS